MIEDLNLKKGLIKNQRCFSQLTDEEIEILATLMRRKEVPAGETIVTEGDRVDSFYLIASGTADVRLGSYDNDKPHSKSIATLTAEKGDAIGLNETGFFSLSGLRTATVVATTPMLLFFITLPLFNGYALSNSHVSEVMREQSKKFVGDF
jgi:CRP-like cAMP-binding protein